MKTSHNWTMEENLLVITEFVKRYKYQDQKTIEQNLAEKIGTTAYSVRLTRKNLYYYAINKREGFGSSHSSNQVKALLYYLENLHDGDDKKLLRILSD